MIEPTSNLTPMPGGPAVNTAPSDAAGGFLLALDAFLDANAPSPVAPPPGVTARQDDAASGKILPGSGSTSDEDSDGIDDAASIWLPPQVPFAVLPAAADVLVRAAPDTSSPPTRRDDATAAPIALSQGTADQPVSGKLVSAMPDMRPALARGMIAANTVSADSALETPLPPQKLLPSGVAPVASAATANVSRQVSVPKISQNLMPPRFMQKSLPTNFPGLSMAPNDRPSSAPPAPRPGEAVAMNVSYQRLNDGQPPISMARDRQVADAFIVPVAISTAPAAETTNIPAPAASTAPVANNLTAAADASITGDGSAEKQISHHTDTEAAHLPVVTESAVRSAPAAVGSIQPARQAFAAALSALSSPRRLRGQGVTDADTPNPVPREAAAQTLSSVTASAPAQTHDAPLDLRQDRGLARMLDHIERLRDDANASDTRIRLVPDALGTVDVAVRRDGEAVHVRFSAASEATRAAIADAQPRLTDLAETRGVKIAGSTVDAGTGGDARPQSHARPDSARPIPAAPRSTVLADSDSTNDQRLA